MSSRSAGLTEPDCEPVPRRDMVKQYGIKYFYDITDRSDFRANPDYKGVCHIALAQEGHCKPGAPSRHAACLARLCAAVTHLAGVACAAGAWMVRTKGMRCRNPECGLLIKRRKREWKANEAAAGGIRRPLCCCMHAVWGGCMRRLRPCRCTGEVLFGTDSHTCNAGAFGQFATGVGNTDAGFILGTGKLLIKVLPCVPMRALVWSFPADGIDRTNVRFILSTVKLLLKCSLRLLACRTGKACKADTAVIVSLRDRHGEACKARPTFFYFLAEQAKANPAVPVNPRVFVVVKRSSSPCAHLATAFAPAVADAVERRPRCFTGETLMCLVHTMSDNIEFSARCERCRCRRRCALCWRARCPATCWPRT